MKISCYTDIHCMETMLNLPTTLRTSAVRAADLTLAEWGQSDLSIVGGDNLSDYPHWNRSCALPYANFLDIKEKLVKNFERTAKGGRVLYVSGNNDPLLGDLPTPENPPYNTCEFYHTGPMKETLGTLREGEYYGKYAKSKGTQAGLYFGAFHYVVDGVDFFGLNLDPDQAFNSHDCGYDPAAVAWLGAKLDEVDPDGTKLLFVVGHLSGTVRTTDGSIRVDMEEESRQALVKVFRGHRNLFYLYGHVHGQEFLRTETWEGILAFDGDGKLVDAPNGVYTDEMRSRIAFYTVHMGGLRPFLSATPFEFFEPDGQTGRLPGDTEDVFYEATGTPKIAQYLLIRTSEEGVSFAYRNAGTVRPFSPEDTPSFFLIPRRMRGAIREPDM